MVTVRPLQWPADRAALHALDTSFVTNQVYQIAQTEHAFALTTVPITPPLRKDYQFMHEVDTLPTFDQVVVAECDATIAGVAALNVEAWNHRAILWHFYIAPEYRGRGVGRHLMHSVTQAAQARGARCVWLETQNINYGAIVFYQRVGFQWCGLDTALYDPSTTPPHEIALFFVRHLVHTET